MKRSIAAALVALVPVFALAAGSVPPPVEITPAVAAQIDTGLQAAAGATKGLTPAISVAVAENGRIAYARAFGVADVTAKTPATPQTRFRIASVTKMMTAVAVMQLVEAGRVRLDEKVASYLVNVPHGGEITIRQLLMHTSGLWNYGDEAIASGRVAKPTSPYAILASLSLRPLDAKPGSTFAYSNTGYVMLGLVVEAVTHRTLGEYEREHIFVPAKMSSTTVGDPPAGTPVAHGYLDATGTAPAPYSMSWFYADGDVVSTASDVARFDAALMSGRLVKPATFAQMQSSAVAAPGLGQGVRYGLGVSLISSGGMTLVGHHGGMPGFATETEMLPAQRYAVVVLTNASDFLTYRANNVVVQHTHPAFFAELAKATPPPAGPEDPAVTAKLRTLLSGLQLGTVDPATLTDAMKAALTPEVLSGTKAQFAPLGALQSLTLSGKESVQGYSSYHYSAVFASGETVPLTISLDKDGKIAGFRGA
jgi:D-alanyl-D-alanine carboxypeptidase